MLYTAGNLDLTRGGPEIPLRAGETSPRRSVYFRHAHERQVKFLELFDSPSPLECYRRACTVVPHQALALFNGAARAGPVAVARPDADEADRWRERH